MFNQYTPGPESKDLDKLRNIMGRIYRVGKGQQSALEFIQQLIDRLDILQPGAAELFRFSYQLVHECFHEPAYRSDPTPHASYVIIINRPRQNGATIDFQAACTEKMVDINEATCYHPNEEGTQLQAHTDSRMRHIESNFTLGVNQRYVIIEVVFFNGHHRLCGRIEGLPTKMQEFTLPHFGEQVRWRAIATVNWQGATPYGGLSLFKLLF